MYKKTIKKLTVFGIIAMILLTSACFAQSVPRIKDIRVKNNRAVSEATILSKIKTRIGDAFSQDILNDDLKRLYAMGYFTDVSIDVEEFTDGVEISIIVEEKPVVEDVVFKGNKKISTRKLKGVVKTQIGEMLNYSKLSQDVNELRALYTQQGFQDVSIRYEVETNRDTNSGIVSIVIVEMERIRIKKISVEGNEVVPQKTVLNLMKTRPAWFFSRGYFDEETFGADLENIKRYYQSLGYLDAAIFPEFQYDEDKNLMYITLKVKEGKKYLTGTTGISGKLIFPEEDIRKQIMMKEGSPFNYAELRRDVDNIREFYYQRGYMNVDVAVDRKLNPATNEISIEYKINANEVVYVGTVDVRGNTKTKDVVVRRELRIYPGDKFDGSKLKRSKERLYNLGFFEDVYFDTEPTNDPTVNNLVVSVKETKTGEFAFGGGYSSIDEFIGFVQITQRNFDLLNFPTFTGDGQFLSLRADMGSVRRDFELSWTEPWIFDYPLSFGFDVYNRTHARRGAVGYGYKESRTGGDLRLGKEFGEYFRTGLMYKLEEVNISDLSEDATQDLVDERGANWISSMTLSLTFDTRDNVFVPKKGFISQVVLEDAGGLLGFDKDFVKGFFLTSFYHTFFNVFVLELTGRAGLADSYGNTDEVPIYERFYAGGANTIRGYRERRVGPRDPGSSDPIGGEAMMIANAEITFPIFEKLIKGAIFYDVGNVWRHIEDYFDGGFKSGVGAGVRVKTPIGPLKLDVGYPLSDNQNDEKRLEWYFSVSHGF